MAENKNWLSQKGNDFNDNEFAELGITEDVIASGNFNRVMLDTVHAQNMAGYLDQGMTEKEARKQADIQRRNAIKAAKENGLTM
jgi:hypothetical protein